ncbi:Endonuclease/Exonuclease/phosphatase family protein [Stieleria neptunia]|uniref:Endonuclease/Exonuclease/phosphatase family protein n=1 Tax=Stieleria neptunia TaxID=2527979 RepID=A0A518HN55_9BACT|nr:lamin tail domain-containing protein [Stieleria neptunia]QDV42273.1 Endonuclease/Exonuclease/phosphatase family protein [Stieleria neptunia]
MRLFGRNKRRPFAIEALEHRRLLTAMRIVGWNTLNNPDNATEDANFSTVLSAIGNETIGSITKRIDVLGLSETDASSIARVESILDSLYPSTDYARIVTAPDGGGDATGFVYDTATVQLQESVQLAGAFTHSTMRAKFRPVGTSGTEDFYAYSVHLKAGTSSSDKSKRASEANLLRNDIDALGQGTSVIVAGDFNMKTSSEYAWGNLTSAGAGQLLDVYGPGGAGNWNDNFSFRHLHSQDPSTSGAGMDDRFDIQFATGEFFDGSGLEYVDGSYHVFGNNGTHTLNGSILTGTGASTTVLNALAAASDHLPIVADYQFSTTAEVVIVETSGTHVTEGGALDSYNVSLSQSPTSNVSVTITPDGQLDIGSGPGISQVLTFTPVNALTPQTVIVSAYNDLVIEGSHQGVITHSSSSSDPNYNGLSVPSVVASITDNDNAPGVSFAHSGGGLDVAEGGLTDSYAVSLDTVPADNVTITLTPDSQLDLGAGAATPIVLTFTPANAQTPQTVPVAAFDDALVESLHTGVIQHSASSADPLYNDIAISQLVAEITDNEIPSVPSIVISEIMYNPDTSETGALPEWLEVVNTGTEIADLGGWYFEDEDTNWGAIPAGTFLPPNEAAVFYDQTFTSEATFRSAWDVPASALVIGINWASLANSPSSTNEVLRLYDDNQVEMDLVNYDDSGAWPSDSPDGPSIYLTDLAADNNVGSNWGRSTSGIVDARNASSPFSFADVGSPGDFPPLPTPASLVVTQSGGSTGVTEGGGADSLDVVLAGTPTANVTVTLTPSNGEIDLGWGAGVPRVLTFTPANAATVQSVTISADNDSEIEGVHWSLVSFTISSSDPTFNALSTTPVDVQITDNNVLGDMNGDGQVDNLDIAAFAMALSDPVAYAQAYPGLDPEILGDFDDDGYLTNLDIAGFAALLS